MDIKTIIAVSAVTLLSAENIYDYFTNSLAASNQTKYEISEAQKAILNDVDPTDILEPTAAGSDDSTDSPLCRTGFVESGAKTQHLAHKPYVSYKESGITYIQIMTPSPVYLRQSALQFTTANILEPNRTVRDNLEKFLTRKSDCAEINLYLAKTTRP